MPPLHELGAPQCKAEVEGVALDPRDEDTAEPVLKVLHLEISALGQKSVWPRAVLPQSNEITERAQPIRIRLQRAHRVAPIDCLRQMPRHIPAPSADVIRSTAAFAANTFPDHPPPFSPRAHHFEVKQDGTSEQAVFARSTHRSALETVRF